MVSAALISDCRDISRSLWRSLLDRADPMLLDDEPTSAELADPSLREELERYLTHRSGDRSQRSMVRRGTGDCFASQEIEREFCRNFTCCGFHLETLHDLQLHYEDYHTEADMETLNAAVSDDEIESRHAAEMRHHQNSLLHHRRRPHHHHRSLWDQQDLSLIAFRSHRLSEEIETPPVSLPLAMIYSHEIIHIQEESDSEDLADSSLAASEAPSDADTLCSSKRKHTDDVAGPVKRSKALEHLASNEFPTPPTSPRKFELESRRSSMSEPTAELMAMGNGDRQARPSATQNSKLYSSIPSPPASVLTDDEEDAASQPPSVMTKAASSAASQSTSGIADSETAVSSTPAAAASTASLDQAADAKGTASQPPGALAAKPKVKKPRPSALSTINPETGVREYICPNCKKQYKNGNGLKYHLTHAHPNGEGIPHDLFYRKKRDLDGFRPYVCPVADCGKRYKNLNGLKYHIEHSHASMFPSPNSSTAAEASKQSASTATATTTATTDAASSADTDETISEMGESSSSLSVSVMSSPVSSPVLTGGDAGPVGEPMEPLPLISSLTLTPASAPASPKLIPEKGGVKTSVASKLSLQSSLAASALSAAKMSAKLAAVSTPRCRSLKKESAAQDGCRMALAPPSPSLSP
ncbi:uncharacterized protein BJ171DRAFT_584758 [Polychytrium aggregatum]|uniref:uncharacterized protein n=1 Tax=Polychytrium aggregatum TaxID=110093 RepID=UPI0022FEA05C|nr:uncharacterized protein BJ171DRAFT_584758 [Polychytrium aggregatum]KAI9201861.1 hypothetical protein BJ171DRAFT_584758 [Polychytrium aggregatum]